MLPSRPEDATVYQGGRDAAWEVIPAACGLFAVYTEAAPDKQTANEDSAAFIPFGSGDAVLAVADGLGGGRGGEHASQTVILALKASLGTAYTSDGSMRAAILDGIEHANAAILERGIGSATTLVAAEIRDNSVRPYHIGDSQILIVGQRGRVKLQSVAHSPTGFAVEAGLLDENDAMHHQDRHFVSNVIGAPDMRIEVGTAAPLAERDTVLLASDGLFDNLQMDEIIDCIRTGSIEQAGEKLAGSAKERMGSPQEGLPSHPDDLTFILFRRHSPKKKT